MTHFLVNTRLDAEQRECVRAIQGCADSLLGMVSDVLDHAKLASSDIELQSAPFDLRTVAEESIELASAECGQKSLDLRLDLDLGGSESFVGDPTRLRQVLLNLTANAVKFTPDGGTVALRVVADDNTEPTLHFVVEDTGIGISEDKLEAIFEPFVQAEAATAESYGGTGLGLTIARQLVRKMGGELRCESEAGFGTKFHFELELERSEHSGPSDRRRSLENYTVNLIDSDGTRRAALERDLRSCGAIVGGAESLGGADESPSNTVWLVHESSLSDAASHSVPSGRVVTLSPSCPVASEQREQGRRVGTQLRVPFKLSELVALVQRLAADSVPTLTAESEHEATVEADEQCNLEDTRIRRVTRILVVDDNAVNRRVAEKLLAKLGYQPQTVCGGQEAIDACARSPFDLVLMDLQMPEVDGFQATREIRAQEGSGRRTPIVALTANNIEDTRAQCLEAGMDDHIAKPVSGELLAKVVNRWVLGTRV